VRWARIVVGGIVSFVGLVVLGLVLVYVAQPTSYRIVRSHVIAAPPDVVMGHLSDLRAFEAWDPWPSLPGSTAPTITFSPTTSGVGAWVERRDPHGSARSTITSLTPDRIVMTNVTDASLGTGGSTQTFELRTMARGTQVDWVLSSELHGLPRLLWPIAGLEGRVGPDMDLALTRLESACR
jgi:hypothetical protein